MIVTGNTVVSTGHGIQANNGSYLALTEFPATKLPPIWTERAPMLKCTVVGRPLKLYKIHVCHYDFITKPKASSIMLCYPLEIGYSNFPIER